MSPLSLVVACAVAGSVALATGSAPVPSRVLTLRARRLAPGRHLLEPLRRRPRRRGRAAPLPASTVIEHLPDVVSLLTLAIGAGLTVPTSLPVLSRSAPTPMRPGLRTAERAIADGRPVAAAIESLRTAWGEAAGPLLHAIDDHLRYGTTIGQNLDRTAVECRLRRRRAAEVRARRVPVLLLFPLVLCTLPAFGLLTVAPLVAGTLGSLDLSPLEAPASDTPEP